VSDLISGAVQNHCARRDNESILAVSENRFAGHDKGVAPNITAATEVSQRVLKAFT